MLANISKSLCWTMFSFYRYYSILIFFFNESFVCKNSFATITIANFLYREGMASVFIHTWILPMPSSLLRICYVPDMVLATRDAILPMIDKFPDIIKLTAYRLEKEMATHPSILAWRILVMEETSGLPSMGSHKVRHGWSNLAAAYR